MQNLQDIGLNLSDLIAGPVVEQSGRLSSRPLRFKKDALDATSEDEPVVSATRQRNGDLKIYSLSAVAQVSNASPGSVRAIVAFLLPFPATVYASKTRIYKHRIASSKRRNTLELTPLGESGSTIAQGIMWDRSSAIRAGTSIRTRQLPGISAAAVVGWASSRHQPASMEAAPLCSGPPHVH